MNQRRFVWIGLLLCGLLAGIARADSFQLNDGSTLAGDIVSANESGMRVRQSDGNYSDVVPWTKFSQADLKKLAQDPKMQPFVSPFIEESEAERIKKTDVGQIQQPPRLKRPAPHGLFGSMLESQVGLFVLLVLYGAGIYAGYEVALFRRRPKGLVCGLAAVPLLGLLSPIIFILMPMQRRQADEEENYQPETAAPEAPSFTVPGAPPTTTSTRSIPTEAAAPASASQPARAASPEEENEPEEHAETHGLHLAHAAPKPAAALPPTQVFQRGAFMFNRRFFETKFPGFFGAIRREADKDMLLVIKAARGEYTAERISRISSNDFHLQVRSGPATHEVMVPFTEIKEVKLKHKDSPD
ncbi:MAG TPA: hypothetical protein VN873_02890 [Candidatus Angelobacter sp.]|nr:hypothetical protein [Candidatus Angelobacter sp.]